MSTAYRLSSVLVGHGDDVRCVAAIDNNSLVSGSRDKTAKLWTRSAADPTVFTNEATLLHSANVSAIACIEPTDVAPRGLIATGCTDGIIRIWDPDLHNEPIMVLGGHTANICAIATSGSRIITGSWDHTARVWEKGDCVQILEGHSNAVWAVLELTDGTILTGSADKSIFRWRHGAVMQRYMDHTDCVRSLVQLNDHLFASCSNDETLRIWSIETGECKRVMHGHTAFVYTLAALGYGNEQQLVSGGEDRTVRVWKDDQCEQSIALPAVSVWSIAAMPSGDIVCAASDAKVRIFTRDPNRVASNEVLEAFERENSNFAMSKQTVGGGKGIDTESLPGPERLNQPGDKNGQTIMIKQDRGVFAYHWDGTSFEWKCIGEVVDSQGSQSKTVYNGKEYDYVFDVELENGRPLKLPYNVNENPYAAANRFVEIHNLPSYHIEEIASFLIKNTEGIQLSQQGGPSDPLTGAHRYIPETGPAAPGAGNLATSTVGSIPNEFTLPSEFSIQISKKLGDIRSRLEKVDNADDRQAFGQILDCLESGEWNAITADHVDRLIRICGTTKGEEIRMSAFDLLSLVVARWPVPALDSESERVAAIVDVAVRALPSNTAMVKSESKLYYGILRMAIRTLANLMYQQPARAIVWAQLREVLEPLQACAKVANKNLQVVLATLLYNLMLHGERIGESEHALDIIVVIGQTLSENGTAGRFDSLRPSLGTFIFTAGVLAAKGSLYRESVKQVIVPVVQRIRSDLGLSPQDISLTDAFLSMFT